MNLDRLCLGERLTGSGWTGLPLSRFSPPRRGDYLPLAAFQDTVFVWRDGASPATVRSRGGTHHYRRHRGVMDLMVLGEEISVRHDRPEEPGECLLVAMPPELREELGHRPRPGTTERLPSLFDLHDTRLLLLADALERQQRDGEPMGQLFTQTVSAALVSHVMVHYARHDPAPADKTLKRLEAQQRARLLRYIEERLDADIGLQDMAALISLSQQQLARLFKNTFGMSPYQYVIRQRVERAKKLLRTTGLSLVEVANACGFSDQPHFTSSFSKFVRLPPGRYRTLTR